MEPDDAARARTSVDCAREGSLTTYARHARRQQDSVAVRPRADGTVEVLVQAGGVAAGRLLSRPVATLRVAPTGCQPVVVHGAARRLPGRLADASLAFHLDIAAVRVGPAGTLVDEQAYRAALPDPLRHDAPEVLAHLNAHHADALAACLRARGAAVGFAHATGLDAGGLTVVAAGTEGLDTLRLRFPAPVASLSQLPVSLSTLLRRGCGCSDAGAVHGRAQDGGAPDVA